MAFTVRFLDYDDSVISTAEYEENTPAADVVVPGDPTRAATQQYTYTFSGWSPSTIADVTADADYKATYTSTVNKYGVTFVDDDGETVLKAEVEYDYGTPFASVEVPDVPDKQIETEPDVFYRFTGWDPVPDAVTEDAVYQAVYEILEAKGFQISFVDDDGYLLEQKEYNFGDTPAYVAPDGFTVTYDPEIVTVSADATYEVTLTKIFEIVKQAENMGNKYCRAAFQLGLDADTDDLPSWAAPGSIAFNEAGTEFYVKGVDDSWVETTSDLMILLMAIPD